MTFWRPIRAWFHAAGNAYDLREDDRAERHLDQPIGLAEHPHAERCRGDGSSN
jgi:hypothetical protein